MTWKATLLILLSLPILRVVSVDRPCDYIQVLHQWQPAQCNTGRQCVENPQEIFTLLGIWPSSFSQGALGPCNGTDFDPQLILSLRARMSKNMRNLINGQEEVLWEKEWSRHGTCTETWFGASDFFCIGLDSYSRHNLTSYLQKSGLNPDGQQLHLKSTFEEAISFVTKKKPGVSCNVDERGRNQLKYIILCHVYTSTAAHALTDCPDSVSSCPDMFMWIGLGD